METRWYFILGDLAANMLVATAALALAGWLLGGGLGMAAGMVLGMIVGLVLGMGLLAPVLGIMETLTPCMFSGMFGGMLGGMWNPGAGETLRWGAGTGLAVVVLIYGLNLLLTGAQRQAN